MTMSNEASEDLLGDAEGVLELLKHFGSSLRFEMVNGRPGVTLGVSMLTEDNQVKYVPFFVRIREEDTTATMDGQKARLVPGGSGRLH